MWGLQGYKNKNKGDTVTTIKDYTSNIGTYQSDSDKEEEDEDENMVDRDLHW